MTKAIVK